VTTSATLLDLESLKRRALRAGYTFNPITATHRILLDMVHVKDGGWREVRVLSDGRVRVFAFDRQPSKYDNELARRAAQVSFHTWDLEQHADIDLFPSPSPRREEDHR